MNLWTFQKEKWERIGGRGLPHGSTKSMIWLLLLPSSPLNKTAFLYLPREKKPLPTLLAYFYEVLLPISWNSTTNKNNSNDNKFVNDDDKANVAKISKCAKQV
jgi:hypothetical protein